MVNYFRAAFACVLWVGADEKSRVSQLVALGCLFNHQPADPRLLALGAAVLFLPGTLLVDSSVGRVSVLFQRGGVGGALLALGAREPNRADPKEQRLDDVVQEMALRPACAAPRVLMVDASGANAAAIGTSPAERVSVVSRGLIDG